MDDEAGIGLKRLRTHKLRGWLTDSFDWVLKRGWIEVEAEVQECTATPRNYRMERRGYAPGFGGYVVSFTYQVDGKTYDGTANSPDELLKGDTFAIRCDPRNPKANNTFDSETNWIPVLSWTVWIGIALLLVSYYVWDWFARR